MDNRLVTIGTPAAWAAFAVLTAVLLALDLGVFRRRQREVTTKAALAWTVVWVAISLTFALGMGAAFGAEPALEFLTGYVLEKALSVDNLFMIAIVFAYLRVPGALQHRVLFLGVLGAIVMRGFFILLGADLVQAFSWTLYVFGAILVASGIKLLRKHGAEVDPERNLAVRLFRRLVPSVPDFHGDRLLIHKDGRRHATPLLVSLVAVEGADAVFAVDSIPTIFGVTTDPFIVFTSNVFAMLGLRSLYFVLARAIREFDYLQPALAAVLVFVGVKMLIADVLHVPTLASLGIVIGIVGAAVAVSIVSRRRRPAFVRRSDP